jgi:predicted molibdopterin-dependent oxidoreductase YjgC
VSRVTVSEKTNPGVVFIPFHFSEAAANLLTIDVLDPLAKIPEYKACAVQIVPVSRDDLPVQDEYKARGRY